MRMKLWCFVCVIIFNAKCNLYKTEMLHISLIHWIMEVEDSLNVARDKNYH